MNGKILVIVYVPLIEREYEMYIPKVKKFGVIKNLVIKMVESETGGCFKDDGNKNFYDKSSGEKIDDDTFVKYSNIKNGSKLILY